MPTTTVDDPILSQFEESLTQTALSPATIINYLSDLRAFCRWGEKQVIPGFSLLRANQEHIRRYRHYLGKELGRAAATVNRHLMSLRKFYTFAVELGRIDLDPMAGVALVQQDGHQPDIAPLTEAEIERLLAAAAHSPRAGLARRDAAILQLMLCTGLRIGEIIDLQKNDLVFDHPGLHLRVCSGQKERELPLPAEMVNILSDYLQVRPQSANGNLFLNQEGRAPSRRTVQRIISESAKAANLSGISAQQLRRTFAAQLFAKTQDLALVSKRLGHQHISITEQYLSNHL
jgi:site-specific recombinase XerD